MLNESAILSQHGFSSVIYGQNKNSIFNNGNIAIKKDLIFGLSVWNGEEFIPMKEATESEFNHIVSLINSGNIDFPWKVELEDIKKLFKNKKS